MASTRAVSMGGSPGSAAPLGVAGAGLDGLAVL